jgi:starch-binding outer membrane protein, SusD/RagB family
MWEGLDVIARENGVANTVALRPSPRSPGFRVLAMAVIALLLAACDDLVEVTAPDRITAESYETPANADKLIAGAVADFECALAQFVSATGIASDELLVTNALTAPHMLDRRAWDTRGLGAAWAVSTCTSRSEATPALYRPMSVARWHADHVLGLLEGWSPTEVPNRDTYISKAAAYAGYALVLLGEVMCAAPINAGPPLQPDALFTEAESRFTRAIAAAQAGGAAADQFRHMAQVGLARARLNKGDMPGARTAAQAVPAGFVKNATYSTATARRFNVVWSDVQGNSITIGPAFRDVRYADVRDPRVKVIDTGRLEAAVNIALWDQEKYPSREAPIPIARYTEAQLIMAEAALAAGEPQTAVDIINVLHTAAGLPGFSSSNPDEILQQIIHERRAELFLEGHRFGDIRRYNVPLQPMPGTEYHKGGTYLDARCFPIPAIETDGNPNV